jgi:hypothetical protein
VEITQHQDWCVEDDTGKVLGRTWANGLAGVGTVVTTLTLAEDGTGVVPAAFFAPDGLTPVPEAEYPDGPPNFPGPGSATTVVGIGAARPALAVVGAGRRGRPDRAAVGRRSSQ